MKTNTIRLAVTALWLALAGEAAAAEVPFDQAQYTHEVAAGKPVVVYLHADWCPTCRAQKPIVDRLSKDPKFGGVTIFVADFDKETALEKALGVSHQSTFVVFKQGHEVTRSTGQTAEPAIRAVLEQAL
ncbi:thioredoxin family protein [Dyella japonica]|uniref:Thioredoxin n=1 Tax=Dyella japonica A8 TaxID=1217721 RepID=A0A075JYH1_9GAMM|nr:thioredoxin family protein [Dyella japonica]AIF46635.1 thioredoxin [Dyella japonica A8]